MPPFLPRWPEDWKPRVHKLAEDGRTAQPNGNPENQEGPAPINIPGRSQGELPYGPREVPMRPWKAVAGMAWIRPDPAATQGGPLWSAAPGAPGTEWEPLEPAQGQRSAFVDKLQDYGGHQVQRFLDIDWVKVAHSVTKDIFPERGQRAALHSVHTATDPISYGQAKDYVLLKYGHIPEGRGTETLGSTLADYIWTEISVRAETCQPDVHYKVVDNRLWYTLGSYVEPPPGIHPCLPPDNDHGRNQVGNIYEALVGLYWLEDNFLGLTNLFLTPMDLDQIEYAQWTPSARRTSVGFLRGANALRCTRFVFVHGGRDYGYRNGGPAPALGNVVQPRPPWLQEPGETLWTPYGFEGVMPQGEHLAPPPPTGPPPSRELPREIAGNGHAASSGEGRVGPTDEQGSTPREPREDVGRTPEAQGGTTGTNTQGQLQDVDDQQYLSFANAHRKGRGTEIRPARESGGGSRCTDPLARCGTPPSPTSEPWGRHNRKLSSGCTVGSVRDGRVASGCGWLTPRPGAGMACAGVERIAPIYSFCIQWAQTASWASYLPLAHRPWSHRPCTDSSRRQWNPTATMTRDEGNARPARPRDSRPWPSRLP